MNSIAFLKKLNKEYLKVHENYENLFRISYMWDHTQDKDFTLKQKKREEFNTNKSYLQNIEKLIKIEEDKQTIKRLKSREHFFKINQIPEKVKNLKNEINKIETKLQKEMATQNTWYIDPKTNKFIKASNSLMRLKMSTEKDKKLRKACFDGVQKTACEFVPQLIKLIKMRNEYAKKVWYKNYYEYKTIREESMKSEDVFKIFDNLSKKIINKIKKNLANLEKETPGITKPRNLSFMTSWNFTEKEDKFFPIEDTLKNRVNTFTNLWINYQWWELNLDLMERNGKYNNWFMHQPIPPHKQEWKRTAWKINFTCNAIPGQTWSWTTTTATLFHEWWHAAHHTNITQEDIINATEYAPSSVARAETQSMFLEEIFYSIERRTKYAKSRDWKLYPIDLYEKKVKKLQKLKWNKMLSIVSIVKFEETVYTIEEEKLTDEFIIKLWRDLSKKYFWFSTYSDRILTVPHIYSRSSSAYYHWYGMAILAFHQRREYFYNKYWYVVDNENIWKEMKKMRKYWSSESFQTLIKKATWKKLSPDTYIKNISKTEDQIINEAKEKIKLLWKQKKSKNNWLNANINIVDWKKTITSNKISNEQMYKEFKIFIEKKLKKNQ